MSIFELVNGGVWSARRARERAAGARRSFSHSWVLYLAAAGVAALILVVPAYLVLRAVGAGAETVETLLLTTVFTPEPRYNVWLKKDSN